MSHQKRYCLNCGTELTDAFCPHCGQKASVGRLTLKNALIDNAWSVMRMDGGVLPTAWLLITRPWVVIRDYIHGHRVCFTQPVRFIVIMCFVNILIQIVLPEAVAHPADQPIEGEGVWNSLLNFISESEIASDLIESVLYVPVVWLVYLPWGSRRFNLAEYSTAYLYLCGAGLVIDLLLTPVEMLNAGLDALCEMIWWIYMLNGLVKHAFRIQRRSVRLAVIFINVVLIFAVALATQLLLYGKIDV